MFRQYFQAYETYIGRPHPPIRREQVDKIMQIMPAVGYDIPAWPELTPEDYQSLISLHFKTRYKRCDFNINHFFSGRIRELRLYESEAGYD